MPNVVAIENTHRVATGELVEPSADLVETLCGGSWIHSLLEHGADLRLPVRSGGPHLVEPAKAFPVQPSSLLYPSRS